MSLPSSLPSWVPAAFTAVLAALICAVILHGLLKSGLAWSLATDIPNDRSLHTRPTPRVGGWGIVPVAALAIWWRAPALGAIAAWMVFLAAVSQVDDRRGLPARVRFAAHLAAAIAVVALYGGGLAWFWWPVVVLAIAWLINLYNFMDGADGLAGGMALFGFGAYAMAALAGPVSNLQLGVASAAIAGAAAGFLLLNFYPARLFLGDAGSISLGFLAGAIGLWGWRDGVWPLWFPVFVFAPFELDATVTLLRRLLRGERFWQAHREHYYQRMVRMGVGHARTACCWYGVMLVGAALAWCALGWSVVWQGTVMMAWAGVLVACGIAVDLRWRRFLLGQNKSTR
jgi:UDP-N-acetylmuramyl pentapeptide phosphotransferase/UDP-N-acetylglucosamine-1-phosphate transferase